MRIPGTVTVLMVMAGCAVQSNNNSQTVGMPNPASAYCIQVGGKLAIKDSKNDQIGICTLADGTQTEEWELYRRDHIQK